MSVQSVLCDELTSLLFICDLGIAPFFVDRPHNETVVMGTSLRLVCRVSGAPRPTVTWSRGTVLCEHFAVK